MKDTFVFALDDEKSIQVSQLGLSQILHGRVEHGSSSVVGLVRNSYGEFLGRVRREGQRYS